MRPLVLLAFVVGCSSSKPEAAGGVPELVEVSAEATAELVAAEAPSQLAVRVRVAAARLPVARGPLHLVLVLDTSGSMVGEPIEAARQAARALIERLRPDDRVAIVAFDSQARVLVPTTTRAAGWRAIARGLARIEARGTTDLAAGLSLGLDLVDQGRAAGGPSPSIDRLVLLGDGVPNDAAALPYLVERARQARVPVTTLGLGLDFDEVLLARLALDTGGTHAFVEDGATIARVFDEEVGRMEQVVARNVVVHLRAGPGVTLEAVPGVDLAPGLVTAQLGDLAAGDRRDVIVPLAVAGRRAGAAVELVDVRVSYVDALAAAPRERAAFVAARASSDPAAVAASVKTPLESARRRAAAASAILEAIRRARAGDVPGGLALLDAAEKETRAAGASLGDAELTALADQMKELSKDLAQLAVAAVAAPPSPPELDGLAAPAPATAPARSLDPAVERRIRSMNQEASDSLR